jgi:hypothetical protein
MRVDWERYFDYAIAGATAYSGSNGLSETAQVDRFVASGRRFGPADLVAVQFIGNDGLNSAIVQNVTHVPTAFDTGNPVLDARAEAARDIANFQKLVNAGCAISPGSRPATSRSSPSVKAAPSVHPTFRQASIRITTPRSTRCRPGSPRMRNLASGSSYSICAS